MKAYEWMVKCTPQTEWIEKKGILLWLAFFFIELGAGAYLVGALFKSTAAMMAGWLFCGVLGGGLHLLYLGRPSRFYRMFARPQTSWISRGMTFVTLFLLLGFLDIILRWTSYETVILSLATMFLAFLVVIYGGFAMCCITGIPLWNTALIPILYVVSGLWGGVGVTLAFAIAQGDEQIMSGAERWTDLFLIGFVLLLITYLISLRYGSRAAKMSVQEIIRGSGKRVFWILIVLIGLGVPIVMAAFHTASIPATLLYLTIACELAGDLGMRYVILKYGFYNPLIPSSI